MEESRKTTPRSIPVRDKRRVADAPSEDQGASEEASAPEADAVEAEVVEAAPDYLDDLRRIQADFDNYRKRMMKEQANTAQRAAGRIVERLLPVLDNFERALEHDAPPGVEMIFKELKAILEAEGLATIDAAGSPFDPRVHEAVDSHEDEAAEFPMVARVYRTGYRFGDQVLRAAMVSVARPAENAGETPEVAPEQEAGEAEG